VSDARRRTVVPRTGSARRPRHRQHVRRRARTHASHCQNWQLWKMAATRTPPTPYARHRSRPHKGRGFQ